MAQTKPKLILAPMATLSHAALRNAIYKFGGCDEYYCEMIHATSLVAGGQFEKYYIMQNPEPEKIVWQLTDSTQEPILKASKIVAELGGIGIDINMGCPAPEIAKHGAGIAWMSKPLCETGKMLEKINDILKNSQTSCQRLSVKCRLGEENFTSETFFNFIEMLISSGTEQIVLHPRTRKQKYSRNANWAYVRKLCDYVNSKGAKISIVGNGDIKDVESAHCALQKAPDVSGLMLGRYAVQKPWLFSQIAKSFSQGPASAPNATSPEPTTRAQSPATVPNATSPEPTTRAQGPATAPNATTLDLLEFCREFLADLEAFQPREFWKTRTQRFFVYFCDNFSFAHYLKTKMLNAQSHTEQLQILEQYFEQMRQERFIKI